MSYDSAPALQARASHFAWGGSLVLLLGACAAAPMLPLVPLGLPAGLDLDGCGAICSPARRPRVTDVVTSPWQKVRSCSPIGLTGGARCDWACAVRQSGPCGNGGTWDLLVLLEDRIGSFAHLGTFALADHGPGSLGFRRSIRIERRGRRRTLVERLFIPRHRTLRGEAKARMVTVRYRVTDGQLKPIEKGARR